MFKWNKENMGKCKEERTFVFFRMGCIWIQSIFQMGGNTKDVMGRCSPHWSPLRSDRES